MLQLERKGLNADLRVISLDLNAEWISGGQCPVVYAGSRCSGTLEEACITTNLPDGRTEVTVMLLCNNIPSEHSHLVSRRIVKSESDRIGG